MSKTTEKRPQDWNAEEHLVALPETHGLSGEALQTWCREDGESVHHLTSWKTAFCADGKAVAVGPASHSSIIYGKSSIHA